MSCEQLRNLEGAGPHNVTAAERAAAARHLDACPACRRFALAALRRQAREHSDRPVYVRIAE